MEWVAAGEWEDIRYDTAGGIAKLTINRPEVRNAFRPTTLFELLAAFEMARDDPAIGVIVLTGEGTKAFCSGGDQRVRGDDGYRDPAGVGRLNVLDLQVQIRRLPKPVIAMVAGYAIGGGHVLHLVCDLTVAADNARFGQTGPKVGSFDAGYGAGLLARTIGLKRAKEIWFLCEQYDAATAERWGLVNRVVPLDRLEEETVAMCNRILDEPARAPPAEGRLQRRHRRTCRGAAARRRRHPALLHERGGPGRSRRLRREAQAGLREVSPQAVIAEAAPRPCPLAVWWIGARPRTLVAAIVPALVGASWAGRNAISIPRSLLALVVAVALQIGVNYANDYFDGSRRCRYRCTHGAAPHVASGFAPPRAVAAAAIVMVSIAAVAGASSSPCSPRRG